MQHTVIDLLTKQQKSLNYFFDHVDVAPLEKLLDVFLACEGVLFFTGVGKSGLVAKKIAVTMTSTGTKALYLPPTDALHGDIGMVSSKDVFVFLSRSGESEELLNLIPFLRNRGVFLVSVTSKPQSRLSKGCDLNVMLPIDHELCSFNLVPTTSSVVQMILGNILAVALMERKGFNLEQYTLNHPAGQIGKKLLIKVKDLMLSGSQIPIAHPKDTLGNVLVELSNKRCGCLLIVDAESRLLGIFTDGDLRRALQASGPNALSQTLDVLMTHSPKWISSEVLAADAMTQMEADPRHPITVLAVLDDEKRVIGLIKMHDLLQAGF